MPVARLSLAVVAAAVASVGACALLVHGATAAWPTTARYSHFRFDDYAPLAAGGVIVAGAAWPLVVRASATPMRLYLSLAVGVSIVALLPDAGLLAEGEPTRAVSVLAAMHVTTALVTCCLVLVVAPPGRRRRRPARSLPSARTAWLAMTCLVGSVTVLGVVALIAVPTDRPTALVPVQGRLVYLLHALTGGVLAVGASVALLLAWDRGDRLARRASVVGLLGTAVGAGGGLLTVLPPQRTIGVVLMLVGAFVAGFAYLAPVVWVDDVPVGAVTSRTGDAGRGDGVLVCVRCRERAADEQGRRDPTLSVDDWATGLLDASVCHLCPDTGLETAATTASCPCCGSSFRQPPGGDGRTWIISPGPGTARAEPAAR